MSRRSQSIQTRLFAGFALMLMATLVVGFLYRRALTNLEATADWVERSQRVRVTLDELMVALAEAESAHRGYMLTLGDSYLAPYRSALPRIEERRRTLRTLVVQSPEQIASLDALDAAIAEKLAEMDDVLTLDRTKDREAALTLLRSDVGRKMMERVRTTGAALLAREDQLLTSRRATAEAARAGVLQLSMWATVCSGLLVVLAGTLLARSITTPLASVAEGAEAIGRGELDRRIAEEGNDELTALAVAFNRMAERLSEARRKADAILALKEESAALVRKMQGHVDVQSFASSALPELTARLGSLQAAFYVSQEAEDDDVFVRVWAEAAPANLPTSVRRGEGLLGETAASQRTLFLGAIVGAVPVDGAAVDADGAHAGEAVQGEGSSQPAAAPTSAEDTSPLGRLRLRSAILDTEPVAMALVPFVFEGQTLGLLEIATDRPITAHDRDLLASVAEVAGVILKAFRAADQTKRLLHGSQDLADELQKQTEELQAVNEELEEKHRTLELQRQELEDSQLTLREQQDELQALNEELEEQASLVNSRNHALEAKNQEIDAARRLVEAKVEELRLSAEFKSQFLANVSHELRTPLNSQLILSRLLQENTDGNLTPQQQGYLRTIHRSGIELLRLVDDILDLAKIEAGRLEIEPEVVDLGATLAELEDAFRELARAKGLSLRVEQPPADVRPTLRTDGHRLKQILKNLIGNAIKFTERGEIVVEIAGASTPKGAVVFRVRDTGIGLSAEQQAHIFEAFRQADGSTSRLYGGTGLGLSISRELATLLGGSIAVESELEKGSTFSVVLGDTDGPVPSSRQAPGPNASNGTATHTTNTPSRPPLRKASTPGLGAVRVPPTKTSNGTSPSNPVARTSPPPSPQAPSTPPAIDGRPEPRELVVVTDSPAFAEALGATAQAAGTKMTTLPYDAEARTKLRRLRPSGLVLAIGSAEMDTASLLRADAEAHDIPVHFAASLDDPRRAAAEAALFLHSAEVRHGPRPRGPHKEPAFVGKSVLLVDDDMRNIFALTAVLEREGLSVSFAEDGIQAITAMNEAPKTHVVLMDLMMPRMDGLTAIRTLRADPRFAKTPILAVTAKAMQGDREACLAAGASDYLTKPVNVDQLLSLLRVWLYDGPSRAQRM